MLETYLELGQDFILSYSFRLFISRFSAMELNITDRVLKWVAIKLKPIRKL